MTAHELARHLLAGQDPVVLISVDGHRGLLSPIHEPEEATFERSPDLEDWCCIVDSADAEPCIVIWPTERP